MKCWAPSTTLTTKVVGLVAIIRLPSWQDQPMAPKQKVREESATTAPREITIGVSIAPLLMCVVYFSAMARSASKGTRPRITILRRTASGHPIVEANAAEAAKATASERQQLLNILNQSNRPGLIHRKRLERSERSH